MPGNGLWAIYISPPHTLSSRSGSTRCHKETCVPVFIMKLLTLSTLLSLAAAAAVPLSERVVGNSFQQWGTLIFENTNFADAEADPNFQALQSIGHNRLLTNYFAITHPSLPNYIAAVAGTTFGIKDDKDPRHHNLTGASIFDRLDAAGISWK